MADKKKAWIIILLILLVFLLLILTAGGMYLWLTSRNQAKIDELNKRIDKLEKELKSETKTNTKKDTTETMTDPYKGWLTYQHSSVDYTLRYPPNWTYEETKGVELDMPADYVTFFSPEKTYTVNFGLREKGSDVLLSGRTGIGAGESVDGVLITVIGQEISKTYHMYNGRAVIIFYGAGSTAKSTVGNNEVLAELDAPGMTWDTASLKGSPEEAIADKIVSSLAM